MFTGIVQTVGRVVDAKRRGEGLSIRVQADAASLEAVKIGDSIAIAGCCLTVTGVEDGLLCFDVSGETLSCTTGLDRPGRVNLEPALRLSDRLGGHLVSGHIDGVGTVVRFERAGAADGSRVLEIETPAALLKLIATKGSIAVDGVSLTVNSVAGNGFAVNLIPHTLAATTLGELTPGARVNLEVDLVARYVARLQQTA
jgi:riboflavin synthase